MFPASEVPLRAYSSGKFRQVVSAKAGLTQLHYVDARHSSKIGPRTAMIIAEQTEPFFLNLIEAKQS